MRLVLDASVAIASLRPKDPAYATARARLRRVAHSDDVVVVPSFFLPEVAGALARLRFDASSIDALLSALTGPPHEVKALGPKAALAAARLAIATRLRGPSAIYVWLAAREGLPLCTLDQEVLSRGTKACRVVAP